MMLAIFLAILTHTATNAQRQQTNQNVVLYVSPSGSDCVGPECKPNDCLSARLPCRSINYAVARGMNFWDYSGGGSPVVRLGPGRYSESVIVVGQPVGAHTVDIWGQLEPDFSCTLSQAEQVIIEPPAGTAAFEFQDLAIGIVRCLTVQGPSSQGFACRQTPASDIFFIKFGHDKEMGQGISIKDSCGLNVGGRIWIGNNMHVFLGASVNSRLTIGNDVPIIALNPVNIDYFALSYKGAIIDLGAGMKFVNPQFISGQQYSVAWAGAIYAAGNAIPGTIPGQASIPGFPGTEGHVWDAGAALPIENALPQQEFERITGLLERITRLNEALSADNARMQQELERMKNSNEALSAENARLNREIHKLLSSTSWRITKPLRAINDSSRSIMDSIIQR
jgi:hypothetical protein